jgi:hypothetical protein
LTNAITVAGSTLDGTRRFLGQVDFSILLAHVDINNRLVFAWSLDNMGFHATHLGIGDTGFGSGVLFGEKSDDVSSRSTVFDFMLFSLDSVLGRLDVIFHHLLGLVIGLCVSHLVRIDVRGKGRHTTCSVMSTTTRESDRR